MYAPADFFAKGRLEIPTELDANREAAVCFALDVPACH
jgi:hypothetical protein